MYRIEIDWYSLVHIIMQEEGPKAEQARKQLLESLISVDAVFTDRPFFLSEEFTLLDCCIAPLLWRLPILGIELPEHAVSIKAYMEQIFQRESFQASLTESERELRAA